MGGVCPESPLGASCPLWLPARLLALTGSVVNAIYAGFGRRLELRRMRITPIAAVPSPYRKDQIDNAI